MRAWAANTRSSSALRSIASGTTCSTRSKTETWSACAGTPLHPAGVRGHLRLLPGPQQCRRAEEGVHYGRRDPHEQHRSVHPGLLDDQQPPDDQRGHPDRAGTRADLPDRAPTSRSSASRSTSRTSSRRASASPTTSRAMAGSRCSGPGGSSTTSSSSSCRAARSAATGGSSTTTRSTRSTGPLWRMDANCPPACAGTLIDPVLGARNQPDRLPARVARLGSHRSGPEADEAAGSDLRLRTPAERRDRAQRALRAQAD